MCSLLSLNNDRGDHCKGEIDDRKAPKPPPIVRYLLQVGTHLIEANDAIDGKVCGKDIGGGLYQLGDSFTRPGVAGEKEQGEARTQKNERRCLRLLEPGA